MYILLFLLIFVVVIVILGLSVVGVILRTIFGIGRRSSSRPRQPGYEQPGQRQNPNQNTNNSSNNEEETYADTSSSNRRRKIFTKDDGEYVDYEEVK